MVSYMRMKPKGGAKNKVILTKEQIQFVENAGRIRLPYHHLATLLGISETTFELILKRQPEVKEAYDLGCAKSSSSYRKTLYDLAVIEKNPRMMEFFGKTMEGLRTTDRVELTGADGAPIEVSKIPKEERLKRIEALSKKLKLTEED